MRYWRCMKLMITMNIITVEYGYEEYSEGDDLEEDNAVSIHIDKSVNINIQDSVVSRSSLGITEHTSIAEEAHPSSAVGYEPKVEKKRIKAELKRAKKEGKA